MNASRLLEPLRAQMRDANHWELAHALLEWSLRYLRREDPAVVVRRAFVSSTFESYCCPPDATLREKLFGAQFLVTFFTGDDGSDETVAAFLSGEEGGPSSVAADMRACHDAWLEGLHGLGRDTRALRAAFRETFEWIQRERRVDRSTLTEERYREFRRQTVAVLAYIACWAAVRGLFPSERAAEALRRAGLLELTVELIYLVNDLGSVERDTVAAEQQQPEAELNLVLLRARRLGSREEAIRQVTALYHEKLQDFRRGRAELAASEHWRERAVRDYVELLRCVSNGNLPATLHLMATRYPGAQTMLQGLQQLEPLPSPE
jgi:hypothetical protein